MKKIICLFFVLISIGCFAQKLNIVPAPTHAQVKEGMFTISSSTKLFYAQPGVIKSANFLNSYLNEYYGFRLPVSKGNMYPEGKISLQVAAKEGGVPGSYTIKITIDEITITGNDEQGVFYGIQSLIQLLPKEKSNSLAVQACNIEDAPRFAYRGLMLDCSRHFFSADFVKQYIDFLAYYKLNTFHWHLTDDQGWRIEIKKYPRLTQVGACRNGTIVGKHPGTANDSMRYCGYYTQKQVKEIVQYAADRYITIIPEIEMPGHASAAIAAYPQLSCFPDEATKPNKGVIWAGPQTGKQTQQSWGVYQDVFCPSDYTFTFLENVLDEVMQLFPSKYIHVGGDECPKDSWKRSEFCQNLIKEKDLKDEHGLQSYFIQRIEKYLNSKGHNIIGWDEILEGGLAPNATVMSWRGEKGGIEAAKQHHKVIMTPTTYVYFDYSQAKQEDSLTIGGYLPLETVYNYDPLPKELSKEEQSYIQGVQANLWTEYITNPHKVEFMIFPRLAALSEVAWTDSANKNFDDFKQRLQGEFKWYDLLGVSYHITGINKGE